MFFWVALEFIPHTVSEGTLFETKQMMKWDKGDSWRSSANLPDDVVEVKQYNGAIY